MYDVTILSSYPADVGAVRPSSWESILTPPRPTRIRLERRPEGEIAAACGH